MDVPIFLSCQLPKIELSQDLVGVLNIESQQVRWEMPATDTFGRASQVHTARKILQEYAKLPEGDREAVREVQICWSDHEDTITLISNGA